MFLYEVTDQFEKHKLKYALIGGYALALQGIVRATVDIDLVMQIKKEDFTKVEKALGEIGLKSRLPIDSDLLFKMRKEYIENRELKAWSFVDFKDPMKQVDILIIFDVRDFKVKRISVGGRKVPVLSLKDLAKLKKIFGRPQDLIDLQSIEEKLRGQKES